MGPLGGGRKKNNGSPKIAPPRAGEDSLFELLASIMRAFREHNVSILNPLPAHASKI